MLPNHYGERPPLLEGRRFECRSRHWSCVKKGWLFLLLSWGFVVAVSNKSNAAVPEPVSVEKVVHQYALTSANDFPSRDPEDWRLLASNDGGMNWTVLDLRKGEMFAERHQRRIFVMTNETAFGLYRLQIDRVRDPQAADAVQLAEIEPLGTSTNDFSTLPIFTDRISAKGENPPLESALQAFDGQITTKWADLADEKPETLETWIQWEYMNQSGLVITNIKQLSLLRGRASEGYPVHIEGVVIGPANTNNQFTILDSTGWGRIYNAEQLNGVHPGQHIILDGHSRWQGGEGIGIQPSSIRFVGPLRTTEPDQIKPGQKLEPNQDFEWVQAEGMVEFPVQSGNHAKFELVQDEHSLDVEVVTCGPAGKLPAAGSHVRVLGVCRGEFNDRGDRVAGMVWVAGLDGITLQDRTANSAGTEANAIRTGQIGNPACLTNIDQIRRLSLEELDSQQGVQVRGVVTELFGDYIQEGEEGVELMWPKGPGLQRPSFGAYVEVKGGTARGDAGGPAITVNSIQVLGQGKMPEPERPSWNQLAGGQMNEDWIEMDALVQATDGSHLLLYHEGRQMMATIRSGLAFKVRALADASVRLRGVCVNATDDRNVVQGIQLIVPSLDYVTVVAPPLNPAAIPVLPISRLYNLGSPNAFDHRVKIKGTLTCIEGRKYFVQDANDSVMAVAKAEVVLTPRARNPRWVFWQTVADEVDAGPNDHLSPGDEVEVTGYVESYGYAPMLTEAVFRRLGTATPVVPAPATATQLATGRYDSSVVSIDGLVLGREMQGPHFVMQIEAGQRVFQASLRTSSQSAPALAPGSVVRLTGVCQMNPISHAELGRAPATFSLLLRTPADIAILKAPSWWTVQRAFGVAGVLVLVLLAALFWVRSLRRKVEERTRRLKQEIVDHEKTESLLAEESRRLHLEILERQRTEADLAKETELLQAEIHQRIRMQAEVDKIHRQLLSASRLAGMAEVATNVLHNVGNVLNSVNVLASSISTFAQKSKAPSVARLAELLDQHQGNLGEYLTEHENGRNVPGHLKRLGAHLMQEQARMLEKAQALTESVQHIKEIVAMQQNYAKVAGVCEKVSLAEIVEDSLKMCGEAMVRHKIEVVQEVADIAPVILDRHKVLQILFNLLDNAKYACEQRGDTEGIIRIRIHSLGPKGIQLQVIDNGIGISRENLSRIFTQGFSTRKSGHGFGLHSSILAAQDMGGTLKVQSDGPGQGATFTLELPLSSERNVVSETSRNAAAN